MNLHRRALPAAVAMAACLALTACTAGITSQAPPSQAPSGASHAASASHPAAASSPAPAASMVSVDDSIGSFPVPVGAVVAENITFQRQTIIVLGSITPERASSFYLAELPLHGYRITSNVLASGNGTGGALTDIEFAGHGYKGTIGGASDLPTPAPSFNGSSKNLVEILIEPK